MAFSAQSLTEVPESVSANQVTGRSALPQPCTACHEASFPSKSIEKLSVLFISSTLALSTVSFVGSNRLKESTCRWRIETSRASHLGITLQLHGHLKTGSLCTVQYVYPVSSWQPVAASGAAIEVPGMFRHPEVRSETSFEHYIPVTSMGSLFPPAGMKTCFELNS